MDSDVRGEATPTIVLQDETGEPFAFRPLRALRDGSDLGELIEWRDGGAEPRLLGTFHRGEVAGQPYLLAADLVDPAEVVAFEPGPDGLRLVDGQRPALIHEQLASTTADWEAARPNLEAAVLGLRGERVQLTDAGGRTRDYDSAGRLFFRGRDLLFLVAPEEPGRAVAFEVKGGGRIEAVADERFLAELHAHLEGLPRALGGRS